MLHAVGSAIRGAVGLPAITVAIGPEGGFEAAELRDLEAAGFVRVRLGGAVLRFETAAASALAVSRAALDAATFGPE
jgi:16S rRNA (uracil1498-N3)-methyltransferase